MKWIKWYSITCICIFIVVAFYMFIFPNKIETIDTSSAYSFVEKKVPNSAVYQGYKKRIQLMVLLQFITAMIIQLI